MTDSGWRKAGAASLTTTIYSPTPTGSNDNLLTGSPSVLSVALLVPYRHSLAAAAGSNTGRYIQNFIKVKRSALLVVH